MRAGNACRRVHDKVFCLACGPPGHHQREAGSAGSCLGLLGPRLIMHNGPPPYLVCDIIFFGPGAPEDSFEGHSFYISGLVSKHLKKQRKHGT